MGKEMSIEWRVFYSMTKEDASLVKSPQDFPFKELKLQQDVEKRSDNYIVLGSGELDNVGMKFRGNSEYELEIKLRKKKDENLEQWVKHKILLPAQEFFSFIKEKHTINFKPLNSWLSKNGVETGNYSSITKFKVSKSRRWAVNTDYGTTVEVVDLIIFGLDTETVWRSVCVEGSSESSILQKVETLCENVSKNYNGHILYGGYPALLKYLIQCEKD